MSKLFCFIVFLFLTFDVISNTELKKDSTRGLLEYQNSVSALNQLLKAYDGNFKKDFNDIIKESKSSIRPLYKNIYFNVEFDEYLKQLITLIKSNNSEIQNLDIRPYYFYDETPNASMLIDGAMFVHLGLFDIIENESQLAMILAHEISHYSHQHSYTGIKNHIEEYNSEDNRIKIIEANREGIDRADRILNIIKDKTISYKQHSRERENEADSVGLEYLRKTPYALDEAITGIQILKKCDTESFDMNVVLKKAFASDKGNFNENWLKKSTSIGEKLRFKLSDAQKDSLRTHPKTEFRYEKLRSNIKDYSPGDIMELSSQTFEKMKIEFKYQIVLFLISEMNLSKAMYYILKYQNEGDESVLLKEKLVEILDLMEKSLDNHTLGKYVEARNPYYMKEYNNLLIFIDNLNVSDFHILKENYRLKNKL